MIHTIKVGQSVSAEPGDVFQFASSSKSNQYRFKFTPSDPIDLRPIIGIWLGSPVAPNGVAHNHPGVPYVDHECGVGRFSITVENVSGPYTLSVSVNPWYYRIFGSIFPWI